MALHCGSEQRERPLSGGSTASPRVLLCPLSAYPADLPHGILEQLRQDIVQRHRDEGETGSHVAIDADPGGVAVLVFTQASAVGSRGLDLDQRLVLSWRQFCFPSLPESCNF